MAWFSNFFGPVSPSIPSSSPSLHSAYNLESSMREFIKSKDRNIEKLATVIRCFDEFFESGIPMEQIEQELLFSFVKTASGKVATTLKGESKDANSMSDVSVVLNVLGGNGPYFQWLHKFEKVIINNKLAEAVSGSRLPSILLQVLPLVLSAQDQISNVTNLNSVNVDTNKSNNRISVISKQVVEKNHIVEDDEPESFFVPQPNIQKKISNIVAPISSSSSQITDAIKSSGSLKLNAVSTISSCIRVLAEYSCTFSELIRTNSLSVLLRLILPSQIPVSYPTIPNSHRLLDKPVPNKTNDALKVIPGTNTDNVTYEINTGISLLDMLLKTSVYSSFEHVSYLHSQSFLSIMLSIHNFPRIKNLSMSSQFSLVCKVLKLALSAIILSLNNKFSILYDDFNNLNGQEVIVEIFQFYGSMPSTSDLIEHEFIQILDLLVSFSMVNIHDTFINLRRRIFYFEQVGLTSGIVHNRFDTPVVTSSLSKSKFSSFQNIGFINTSDSILSDSIENQLQREETFEEGEILNLEAVSILFNIFSKMLELPSSINVSSHFSTIGSVCIVHIIPRFMFLISSFHNNSILLLGTGIVCRLLQFLKFSTIDTQFGILKIFEYALSNCSLVPDIEFNTLASAFSLCPKPIIDWLWRIKIIKIDLLWKNGLVEHISGNIIELVEYLSGGNANKVGVPIFHDLELFKSLVDLLCKYLSNFENAEYFRSVSTCSFLDLSKFSIYRDLCFRIIPYFADNDSLNEIIVVLHDTRIDCKFKKDLCKLMSNMLSKQNESGCFKFRDVWKNVGGFEACLALLSNLCSVTFSNVSVENKSIAAWHHKYVNFCSEFSTCKRISTSQYGEFASALRDWCMIDGSIISNPNSMTDFSVDHNKIELFCSVMNLLTSAIRFHPLNRSLLFGNDRWKVLYDSISLTNYHVSNGFCVIQRLLLLAMEDSDLQVVEGGYYPMNVGSVVYNSVISTPVSHRIVRSPEAILVLMRLLRVSEKTVQLQLLRELYDILYQTSRNKNALSHVDIMKEYFELFGPWLIDSFHEGFSDCILFVELVSTFHITSGTLFQLVKMIPHVLLDYLLRFCYNTHDEPSFPYLEFDQSKIGKAAIVTPLIGSKEVIPKSWPDRIGVSMWIQIRRLPMNSQNNEDNKLRLFDFSLNAVSFFSANITNDLLQVTTNVNFEKDLSASNMNSTAVFAHKFRSFEWTHLFIIHEKSRIGGSNVKLYVNGSLSQILKLSYPNITRNDEISLCIGTNSSKPSDICWRLSSFLSVSNFNEALISRIFSAGPEYYGIWDVASREDDIIPANISSGDVLASYSAAFILPFDIISSHPKGTFCFEESGHVNPGLIAQCTVSAPFRETSNINLVDNYLVNNNENLMKTLGVEYSKNLEYQSAPVLSVDINICSGSGCTGPDSLYSVGILVGDVYALKPLFLANSIRSSGGVISLLSIVVNSNNSTELAYSLVLLHKILLGNKQNMYDMYLQDGYKLLSFHLSSKFSLINNLIIDVLIAMVYGIDFENPAHGNRAVPFTSSCPCQIAFSKKLIDNNGGAKLTKYEIPIDDQNPSFIIANVDILKWVLLDVTLWKNVSVSNQLYLFSNLRRMICDSPKYANCSTPLSDMYYSCSYSFYNRISWNGSQMKHAGMFRDLFFMLTDTGILESVFVSNGERSMKLLVDALIMDGMDTSDLKYLLSFIVSCSKLETIQRKNRVSMAVIMLCSICNVLDHSFVENIAGSAINQSGLLHVLENIEISWFSVFFSAETPPVLLLAVMTFLSVLMHASKKFAEKWHSSSGGDIIRYQIVNIFHIFSHRADSCRYVCTILFSIIFGHSPRDVFMILLNTNDIETFDLFDVVSGFLILPDLSLDVINRCFNKNEPIYLNSLNIFLELVYEFLHVKSGYLASCIDDIETYINFLQTLASEIVFRSPLMVSNNLTTLAGIVACQFSPHVQNYHKALLVSRGCLKILSKLLFIGIMNDELIYECLEKIYYSVPIDISDEQIHLMQCKIIASAIIQASDFLSGAVISIESCRRVCFNIYHIVSFFNASISILKPDIDATLKIIRATCNILKFAITLLPVAISKLGDSKEEILCTSLLHTCRSFILNVIYEIRDEHELLPFVQMLDYFSDIIIGNIFTSRDIIFPNSISETLRSESVVQQNNSNLILNPEIRIICSVCPLVTTITFVRMLIYYLHMYLDPTNYILKPLFIACFELVRNIMILQPTIARDIFVDTLPSSLITLNTSLLRYSEAQMENLIQCLSQLRHEFEKTIEYTCIVPAKNNLLNELRSFAEKFQTILLNVSQRAVLVKSAASSKVQHAMIYIGKLNKEGIESALKFEKNQNAYNDCLLYNLSTSTKQSWEKLEVIMESGSAQSLELFKSKTSNSALRLFCPLLDRLLSFLQLSDAEIYSLTEKQCSFLLDQRWKLDFTETPSRLRSKLQINLDFYRNYKLSPNLIVHHIRNWFLSRIPELKITNVTNPNLLKESDFLTDSLSVDFFDNDLYETIGPALANKMNQTSRFSVSENLDINENKDDIQELKSEESGELDNILRFLEPHETVLENLVFNCSRVNGLDIYDGVVILCERNVYIIDGFRFLKNSFEETVPNIKTAEFTVHISDSSILTEKVYLRVNKVHKNADSLVEPKMTRSVNCVKRSYISIQDVRKVRYQLQYVGMELFFVDGTNFLIVFSNQKERDSCASLIIKNEISSTLKDASLSSAEVAAVKDVSGTDDSLLKYSVFGNFNFSSNLIINNATSVTSKWVDGEIDNFTYLMYLNTLAGRSANDLTQYPVFPWILCDYHSETLNLQDSSIYRDLGKPMGAIGDTRSLEFQTRFKNWDDPLIPKFHYGTHYSSSAGVLYYLLRIEPYSKIALELQGGKFDHADRIFSSVSRAFELSSSSGGMSDVKELIPEFFVLPEFLLNQNFWELGHTQKNLLVDDVSLPNWAKGDAHRFIRLHRAALESEHVSSKIHEWIDLIFGFKQKGQAAIDAQNVFYYLTYPGAVNVDDIKDPIEKLSVIAQINNFGQTPLQLFTKPHPVRKNFNRRLSLASHPQLAVGVTIITSLGQKITSIWYSGVAENRLYVVTNDKALVPPNFTKYIAWGFLDNSLRFCVQTPTPSHPNSNYPLIIHDSLVDSQITVAIVSYDGRLVFIGLEDSTIRVFKRDFELKYRRLLHVGTLWQHTGAITCMTSSTSFRILVSGATDCQVIIWDLNTMQYVRSIGKHDGPISCIAVSIHGDIVTASDQSLNLFSINGYLVASFTVSRFCKDRITSIGITSESIIISGHDDGTIRLFSLDITNSDSMKLTVKRVICNAHNCTVTSIHQSGHSISKFWSGDMNGTLVEWSVREYDSHWVADDQVTSCVFCSASFNTLIRKHHCRSCGKVFCDGCTSNRLSIPFLGYFNPERICWKCFDILG